MERIYSEVKCDYNDGDFWCVDAWKTNDPNEEGSVIAVINDVTGGVYAIKDLDDVAKEVIKEKVKEIKGDYVETLACLYNDLSCSDKDKFLSLTGNE